MSMVVTIYGSSDDLIEIDGDIREEFPYVERGIGQMAGDLLAFSDGTVLRIEYTDAGVWRLTRVARGTAALVIEQAVEADAKSYSDRATLTGEVSWVVQGISYAPVRSEAVRS